MKSLNYCSVCDQQISVKNLITHPETGDDFHKNCVDYESQMKDGYPVCECHGYYNIWECPDMNPKKTKHSERKAV